MIHPGVVGWGKRLFTSVEGAVKYLCLIYLDEHKMAALPAEEMNKLNAGHLNLNDALLTSGHLIEAEALEPVAKAAWLRVRGGKTSIIDGPYSEAKEVVAGFYLIEARDMSEAIQVAARFPSAPLGTVEVRPTRQLVVAGLHPGTKPV